MLFYRSRLSTFSVDNSVVKLEISVLTIHFLSFFVRLVRL